MAEKRIDNLYEVTCRLIGQINPIGETNTDNLRRHNLIDAIDLVEKLISDIILVGLNKGRHEKSMNECGMLADKFITELKANLGCLDID